MTKILIILLIAFSFEAFGVIALKKGINARIEAHDAHRTTVEYMGVMSKSWLGIGLNT